MGYEGYDLKLWTGVPVIISRSLGVVGFTQRKTHKKRRINKKWKKKYGTRPIYESTIIGYDGKIITNPVSYRTLRKAVADVQKGCNQDT